MSTITGTSSRTFVIEIPCDNPWVPDDQPCEVEEWIRTDGLPTGFLTCERHMGSAGFIIEPGAFPQELPDA